LKLFIRNKITKSSHSATATSVTQHVVYWLAAP
jgi:hypothetical protein